MRLDHLDIVNFKNIAEAQLDFSAGANCLLGLNGMGKSNLLEAVHFLSMARGMTPMPESALIRHGADSMLLKGQWTSETDSNDTVACGLVRGKGKTLKVNGKDVGRISAHIGRFPVVTVTPQDSRLVSESGEERRRLMDMVISQGDPAYLSQLIRYNKALESRNKMLRAGLRDKLLFESVEAGMAEAASAVHEARMAWTETMRPEVSRYYTAISSDRDHIDISYRSSLNSAPLQQLLDASREKDQVLGFTTQGPHRDDLGMELDGYSLRRLGSQGQVKTFTISLRLAIYGYLRRLRGERPLLLLDDIFDKLDATRVGRIMELVSGSDFGQIFITDTNREHLDEIMAGLGGGSRIFEVADGNFTPLTPAAP